MNSDNDKQKRADRNKRILNELKPAPNYFEPPPMLPPVDPAVTPQQLQNFAYQQELERRQLREDMNSALTTIANEVVKQWRTTAMALMALVVIIVLLAVLK